MPSDDVIDVTVSATGFPGIAYTQQVDEVNGYVLVKLNPTRVWQPGIWQSLTTSQDATFTLAEFQLLAPKMKLWQPGTLAATYDVVRGAWTYPVPEQPYVFF